jgi:hypothetical protein
MNAYLIGRLNVPDEEFPAFQDWCMKKWLPDVVNVPGVASSAIALRALRVDSPAWNYIPDPLVTIIVGPSKAAGLAAIAATPEVEHWIGRCETEWRGRSTARRFALIEQIFGEEASFNYEKVLLTQMDVEPALEVEFNHWYNVEHIVDAAKLPGFGRDHRRFRAIEVAGSKSLRTSPRYTATYEIDPGSDIEQITSTAQYQEFCAMFTRRWRSGTLNEVSTMCERLH